MAAPRYVPLGHADGADGRPPKTAAVEIWKLASQRKSAVWMACLLLILCFIFAPMFSSDSIISYSAEEQEEQRETRPADVISPSIQEHPQTPPADTSPSTEESIPHPLTLDDMERSIDFSVGGCNIFRGDWVPYPIAPAYTNASCPFIHNNQNCLRNGKPDLGFLYWRWKPYHCELPVFDAKAFLKLVVGKKWAFVGDSIGRNSFQSVLCLLSQVEMPESTYNDGYDGSVDWYFKSYNFTLAIRWAPYWVKFTEDEAEGFAQGIEKLYVDVVHETWAPELHTFDYLVLSAGHWFFRPSVYFVGKKLVGCHYLPNSNVTDVGFSYGYRGALRTVFDFLISSKYKGVVFLKTFAPSHWENGLWNEGGNCTRKEPSQSKSTALEGQGLDMYTIQLEEIVKILQRSSEFSFKLKIVDTTHTALLRPDAHPGPYGHFNPKAQNDCLHWCLPGAVETWSAMFLDVLRHL